jgi:hypothetical protein
MFQKDMDRSLDKIAPNDLIAEIDLLLIAGKVRPIQYSTTDDGSFGSEV